MKTITATRARSDFNDLLSSTIKHHKQYRIASDEGGAVLLSEEEYESLIETLELLSVPGFYESIKQADKEIEAGEVYSMDDVFGEV
jgi:antitoxin YefM